MVSISTWITCATTLSARRQSGELAKLFYPAFPPHSLSERPLFLRGIGRLPYMKNGGPSRKGPPLS
jgi:hypothetical protein